MKIPQSISHEKVLVGCDPELAEFLRTMDVLGAKLGPIVFQFPFFNKSAFQDRHEFLDRLVPFLAKLPNSYKFAIEIRNRNWLDAELASLLRDRNIALVLQDRSWMPSPSELKFDPITAGWTYIRWLGDRKAIIAKRFTYDPDVITLKKGEPVVLVLRSIDVTHGLKVDGLNIKSGDIKKDQETEIQFTPQQTGHFIGQCAHFCGKGHGQMKLQIDVVP